MMTVPLMINEREFDLVIALELSNLDRMREHDPAEIVKAHLGEPWTRLQMRNIVLAYLTEKEAQEFPKRMRDDSEAALKWLTRGFRYRPDRGDHDDPYQKAKVNEGKSN